ncbi:MAG: PAS domain-containing protein, partial [Chthoniobacteraceae bacterium]
MIAHTTQQFLEGHPVLSVAMLGGVLLVVVGCGSWAFLAHYHRQRLRFEMLLTDLLADFSDAGTAEIDGKIRRWLEVIGRFFEVDRVVFSLLEEDGSGLKVIHDFAREGIPRLDPYLYTEDAPWMFKALYAGEVLNVRRVPRDLPRDAGPDHDHFRRLRLKSLLVVPLKTRESGTYLVSFGYVRTYGQWAPDTHLRLRLVCEVFARALAVAGAMEVEARLVNAVKEEQRRMNSILREFRGVVWEIHGAINDPTSHVEYMSENVVDLIGYTAQEWTSQPQFWLKVLHPDDREAAVAAADQLFQKGGFAMKQFRWVRKGGGTLWLEAHMAVSKDEQGRAIGLRGVIIDISRRKQTEQAYEESQRLIRRIAETMPSILYLYDFVENRNLFCNRRIQTVLGYTEAEVQAMGHGLLQQLIHPDDTERVAAHGRKLAGLADEEVMELEYRLRARNGQYRWLFGRETVFTREADGRPRSILGVAHDVTSRRRDQVALRQSEELNRAVIDSLSSLIVILDQEGRVLAANRAWQNRWAKTRRSGSVPVEGSDGVLEPAGIPIGKRAASTAALRKGLERVLAGPACDF